MRHVTIIFLAEDMAHILDVPLRGWDHYVKFKCPPLDNMESSLASTRKFSRNPNIFQHSYNHKREMSPLD